MENRYGNMPDVEFQAFTGEVPGYRLTKMFLNEKGVCEVEFSKSIGEGKEINLRGWINPVDENQVKVFEGQTQEEALNKAYDVVNATIKSIVRNFCTKEQYADATKSVNSYETLVQAAISCLPADYTTKEGTLLVGYNKKGFLGFPNRVVVFKNGGFLPFFTTSGEKLMNMPSNLGLEKPQPVTADAEQPAEVSWS